MSQGFIVILRQIPNQAFQYVNNITHPTHLCGVPTNNDERKRFHQQFFAVRGALIINIIAS
jgi:hypothetical protein